MCDFSDIAEQGDRTEGVYLDKPRAEDSSYTSSDLGWMGKKVHRLEKRGETELLQVMMGPGSKTGGK